MFNLNIEVITLLLKIEDGFVKLMAGEEELQVRSIDEFELFQKNRQEYYVTLFSNQKHIEYIIEQEFITKMLHRDYNLWN